MNEMHHENQLRNKTAQQQKCINDRNNNNLLLIRKNSSRIKCDCCADDGIEKPNKNVFMQH